MADNISDEKNTERPEIKVVDRRSFTSTGEKRDSEGDSRRDEVQEPRPGTSPDPPAGSGRTVQGPGFTMQDEPEGERSLPDGDPAFINLCVSIFESGCIHLGMRQEGEPAADEPPDLVGARGAISMLEMINRKTRGNLSEEEQKILSSLLADLKMAYVMKAPGASS